MTTSEKLAQDLLKCCRVMYSFKRKEWTVSFPWNPEYMGTILEGESPPRIHLELRRSCHDILNLEEENRTQPGLYCSAKCLLKELRHVCPKLKGCNPKPQIYYSTKTLLEELGHDCVHCNLDRKPST